MVYALTWLPKVLRDAGLRVAEVPGWRERGLGDVGDTFGVLCHHTGCAAVGNMPSLHVLIQGRPGLRGPLSQLGLGRDGTYYMIAAGKAHHAGAGIWHGISDGNTHLIGIEAENAGDASDPWPEAQLLAYQHGVAAILEHLNLDAERCAGHKEYAPRRKVDPTFDMSSFRSAVRAILDGAGQPLTRIPAAEPDGQARETLWRGAHRPWVTTLQRRLGLQESGLFDSQTEARVRAFQRANGLVPDGIVGPKSWAALDANVTARSAAGR